MKKYIVFILLFIGCLGFVKAQNIKTFSTDEVQFLTDLTDYFENNKGIQSDQKKEVKELLEQFNAFWNSNKLKSDQKSTAISLFNSMLKRKMKALPTFRDYMRTLEMFANSKQSPESFTAWINGLESLTHKNSNSDFNDYLRASELLFQSNTIYKSASTEWRSSNADFKFAFDKDVKIVFSSLDLKCYARDDSAVIYKTSGVYFPADNIWKGEKGIVYWDRAGFARDSIHAELRKYTIKITNSLYKADSVTFYYTSYFRNQPLLGTFMEKVLADVNEEKASYPRFESYNQRFIIKNIFKDIDYVGGFAMNGRKFIGMGTSEKEAALYFKRHDTLVLKATSKRFAIRPDRITSQHTKSSIYYAKDSIYHPDITLKYFDNERLLSLIRVDEGVSMSPFYNTYHKIDMDVEGVHWKIDEPLMTFKNIGTTGAVSSAYFESNDFYSENRYVKIQGIDEVHPLAALRRLSYKKDTAKILSVEDIANYLHKSTNMVKPMLIQLSVSGFLTYDFEKEEVLLKDKVYHYLNAKIGKSDYDVISFSSKIKNGNNAKLNLYNFDFDLYGVREVLLSDSQSVFIFPKNEHLTLKKNRDFVFEGIIQAGRFDYFGKGFSFEYDMFRVNMENIDSLRIWVERFEPVQPKQNPLVACKTVIENVTGNLSIDHPKNKSGAKKDSFPQYPIFYSKKDSYVYYDRIQEGKYPRENFYFHLDPFTIDSLANFKNTRLRFDGTFVSASIFPDIKETLKLQPDYSLGFVKSTPPEGYPMYGGKGTFLSEIKLSHQGLKGNGDLKYITSTTKSNDFIFFPDSVNAIAQLYTIEPQKSPVEYPSVVGEESSVHWEPYKDRMHVTANINAQKPLVFYKGQSKFFGHVDLTPEILTGGGRMEFLDAMINSKLFKFKEMKFDADTADFRLMTSETKELAFLTTNYKSHIDFEERMGEFKSNGGGSFVEFPFNQYICFMDQFKWFMDAQEIEMKSSKATAAKEAQPGENSEVEYEGSQFISIHPNQDSLSFVAPFAKYSLKDYIINAKDVRFIKVADAKIYPNEGNVNIQKYANMEVLDKAKILANDVTKYHNLFNAQLKVHGKYKYFGFADYEYTDELNRKQIVHFDTVGVDTTRQTFALGKIDEKADFTLSPNYRYKGRVKLSAKNEFLNFAGTFRINHDCDTITKSWVRFKSDINPKEIYIPVDSVPREYTGQPLVAALTLSMADSTHIYPAFLTRKKSSRDIDVLKTDGFIYFDKKSKEYIIASKDRLLQPLATGNYLSINTKKCELIGEGKINLGLATGNLAITTYGTVDHTMNNSETKMDLVMLIDFLFDEDVLKTMATQFAEYPTLQPINLNKQTYKKALYEIFGQKKADKLIADIGIQGEFKSIPKELNHTMVLTDVALKWNSETGSYRLNRRVGINVLGKTQINKMANAKIEFVKKRSGDILNIYIEADSYNWYYFNYNRGVMSVVSSNEAFNKQIEAVKAKNKEIKTDKGEYKYILSTERTKRDFLKRFESFDK